MMSYWTELIQNTFSVDLKLCHNNRLRQQCVGQCYCVTAHPPSFWCMIKALHLTGLWLYCHCSVLHTVGVILIFSHKGEAETVSVFPDHAEGRQSQTGCTFPWTKHTVLLLTRHGAPHEVMWSNVTTNLSLRSFLPSFHSGFEKAIFNPYASLT